MTQEERELLLKDLCARLPYNILMNGNLTNNICRDNIDFVLEPALLAAAIACGCKPYLRPMSSMTEDEIKELSKILNYEFYIDDDFALAAEDDRHRIRLDLCEGYIDWLNSHHFDYRELIEKGLALEAPEDMYKTEKK